jgi:hypothetical protein
MHGEAAQDHPVATTTCPASCVLLAKMVWLPTMAVVRQVGVGHDPVVVAHRVTPPAPGTEPMLKVQNSRMVLRSPMISSQGSPAYFLSCGIGAQRIELEDAVVAPMVVWPFDHAMHRSWCRRRSSHGDR